MKWIITFFSILTLLITTVCIVHYIFPQVASDTEHIKNYVKESTYPEIKIESEIGEYEKYKYAIHFPKTTLLDINQILKKFVVQQKEDFLAEAKNLKITNDNYSELLIDYKITYLSDQILSIIFRNSTKLVGQQEKEDTMMFNFDRQTGQQMKIESFIDSKQLLSIIEKQLSQDTQVVSWVANFEQDFSKYSHFYFSNDSLNIEFEPHLVATTDSQSYIFEIPFHKLNGIINDQYLTSLVQVNENKTEILSSSIEANVTNQSALIPGDKYIALTFDDGPHYERTPYILDILKRYDIPATFYVLGNRAEYYPEIVKRAYDEGHEIGNHTWSHPKLTNLSEQQLLNQVNQATNLITNITGEAPATIRPPYGAYNDTVRNIINLPIVNWSVDTLDWKHGSKEKIIEIVKKSTKNGSIILMHDIHQATADAIEDVIIELTNQGYHFVTVSTLLELDNNSTDVMSPVYTHRSMD